MLELGVVHASVAETKAVVVAAIVAACTCKIVAARETVACETALVDVVDVDVHVAAAAAAACDESNEAEVDPSAAVAAMRRDCTRIAFADEEIVVARAPQRVVGFVQAT